MQLYINHRLYEVHANEFRPTISLNEYIRDVARLKGTKVMCREGGCGACTVTVTIPTSNSNTPQTFSINSCLCPLYIVDGWEITTIEGLGSQEGGANLIQTRIADGNGSQCGYCTPGMVMNMYGLLHKNPKPDEEFIENNFDGNICRCTGYRPILNAMKSFAIDAHCGDGCLDIEELDKTVKICSKTKQRCRSRNAVFGIKPAWYQPTSLKELTEIISDSNVRPYRFVFGNTSTGIFKEELPTNTYINIRYVKELLGIKMNGNCLEIGANVSLSTLIDELSYYSNTHGFSYLKQLSDHWKKIGSILIRNVSCWAGNLIVKHKHPTFPSDLFTTLESVDARIEIHDLRTSKTTLVSLLEFMEIPIDDKIIINLHLYSVLPQTFYRSFKIMPRSQNTHAYVNAGFRFVIDPNEGQILQRPSIVFGGLGSFIHASKTEEFLENKILSYSALKVCLTLLQDEVIVDDLNPVLSTARYRKQLSINLFYKTFISLIKDRSELDAGLSTDSLTRGISSGEQHYQVHNGSSPLKQPIIKLTALAQACGEAVYVDDFPQYKDELYGSFVLSTVGNSTIEIMDFSEALSMDGVVEVITAKDIPVGGDNSYLFSLGNPDLDVNIEAICSGKVWLPGQIIAVILATSQGLADIATKSVKVSYSPISPPIVTDIQDAIKRDKFDTCKIPEKVKGNPTDAMSYSSMVTSGECKMGTQFHFYMENQISLCVPIENGLDIYCSTQYPDYIQKKSASLIGKPANYVNVSVPRLGGAFGGKSVPSSHLHMACALAAFKTKRPVRLQVKMEDTFESTGKRFPMFAKYKVGHDVNGKINAVIVDVYCDMGWKSYSAVFVTEIGKKVDQGYDIDNWLIRLHMVNTNKPPNAACRSPGSFPAALIIESIVEHVASVVKIDPVTVKELNLYSNGKIDLNGDTLINCTLPKMWKSIKDLADVKARKDMIYTFNKNNKWKKKGITMTPVKYGLNPSYFRFTCEISIYSTDGSVTVSQGGVDMGQGLYTTVTQAVAATLGIPITFIQMRATNTFTSPNNLPTANSVGTELCVQAAIECCQILNDRMAPMKLNNPKLDWKDLVSVCNMCSIDLTAKHTYYGCKDKDKAFKYSTYAVGVTEVEIDLLTGENLITRVDLMVDCGDSLNPLIDIGQIEGAYVMGLGAVLLEDIVYDPESGKVLNNGTWDYNPPTSKDIPIDWRIHLLPDSPNPDGVKGSKAVSEPPLLLSTGALFAIKQAIHHFTKDKDINVFSKTEIPFTVEKIQQCCDVQIADF